MLDNEQILEQLRELGRELIALSNKVASMDTTLGHLSKALDDRGEEHQRHVHELRGRVREIEQNAAVKGENLDIKIQVLSRAVDKAQSDATTALDLLKDLMPRVRGLERYIWMGIGGLAVLEIALKFIK